MSCKCDKCICKHCAIAQINGGATGCGNCTDCINDKTKNFVNNCNEFYSSIEIKQFIKRQNEK